MILRLYCLLLVLINATLLQAQSFSWDSCQYYFGNHQDVLLKEYLDRHEQNLNQEDRIGYYYFNAQYHRLFRNTEAQLKSLVAGLELAEKADDSIRWKFFDELAITYKRDKSPDKKKALEYIDKAIRLKHKANASDNALAKSYMTKGNIYYRAEGLDSSLNHALHFYNVARELNSNIDNKYSILANVAMISSNLNQLDSVESQFKEVLEYKRKKGHRKSEANTLNSLIAHYISVEEYPDAIEIFDTLMPTVEANGWKQELKNLIITRAYLEEERENWKEVVFWRDSLSNLETTIDADRMDEQISRYTLENKLAKEEAKSYRNRFWLSILLGATSTLCIVLFGLYKYFGIKKRAVLEQLEATKMKAAFDATRAKMEGEQLERESIASVLHDQVASLLTAADMHLKVAQKKDPEASGLTKAGNIIKDINSQVRDISHQLVSPTLTKFGLEAGLDTLTNRMTSELLSIDYESKLGPLRLDHRMETFVFQSCSELIQNVIKHSTAENCKVSLLRKASTIHLEVRDNGDNSNVDLQGLTGLGLTHIYNRAEALGGSFDFDLRNDGAVSKLTVPASVLNTNSIIS